MDELGDAIDRSFGAEAQFKFIPSAGHGSNRRERDSQRRVRMHDAHRRMRLARRFRRDLDPKSRWRGEGRLHHVALSRVIDLAAYRSDTLANEEIPFDSVSACR